MKPYLASLINAITLIIFGAWGYFASDDPSPTAFIPVGFGIVLLALNNGVKKENKVIAHIAVVITLVVLIGLFMPLRGAIERADQPAVIRVALMILTTLMAMAFFIKSFIDARRKRS